MSGYDGVTWVTLDTAEDVTDEIVEAIESITDGWFLDKPIDWESVWERFEGSSVFGPREPGVDARYDLGGEDDTPFMRKVRRIVLKHRRES